MTSKSTAPQESATILIALTFAAVLVFFLFVWVEGCTVERKPESESETTRTAHAAERKERRVLAQLLTGTSLPDLEPLGEPKNCLLFAGGQALHTLLSAATGLTFLWFVYQMVATRRRRKVMQIAKVLKFKEISLRAQVENMLLEGTPKDKHEMQRGKVQDVFDRADRAFKKKLIVVLGEAEAQRVLKEMEHLHV